jgi:hypothetical protein
VQGMRVCASYSHELIINLQSVELTLESDVDSEQKASGRKVGILVLEL